MNVKPYLAVAGALAVALIVAFKDEIARGAVPIPDQYKPYAPLLVALLGAVVAVLTPRLGEPDRQPPPPTNEHAP